MVRGYSKSTYWKSFRRIDSQCVRVVNTLVSLNDPNQPHLRPPPTAMGQELNLSSAQGTSFLPKLWFSVLLSYAWLQELGLEFDLWLSQPWFSLAGPMHMILAVTCDLSHHWTIALGPGLWVDPPSQVLSCLSCWVLWDEALASVPPGHDIPLGFPALREKLVLAVSWENRRPSTKSLTNFVLLSFL